MPSSSPPSSRFAAAATVPVALAVIALLAGCTGGPAPTTSSPSPSPTASPVTVEELGAGGSDAAIDVEVPGPVTVTYRRITLEPGAGTGLHCHHGQLIAVVEQGEFTHYAPVHPGGVAVYEAGDTIVEGASYVHEGVNESDDEVVLLVTYVTAEGEPLAETDLAECDPVHG